MRALACISGGGAIWPRSHCLRRVQEQQQREGEEQQERTTIIDALTMTQYPAFGQLLTGRIGHHLANCKRLYIFTNARRVEDGKHFSAEIGHAFSDAYLRLRLCAQLPGQLPFRYYSALHGAAVVNS